MNFIEAVTLAQSGHRVWNGQWLDGWELKAKKEQVVAYNPKTKKEQTISPYYVTQKDWHYEKITREYFHFIEAAKRMEQGKVVSCEGCDEMFKTTKESPYLQYDGDDDYPELFLDWIKSELWYEVEQA